MFQLAGRKTPSSKCHASCPYFVFVPLSSLLEYWMLYKGVSMILVSGKWSQHLNNDTSIILDVLWQFCSMFPKKVIRRREWTGCDMWGFCSVQAITESFCNCKNIWIWDGKSLIALPDLMWANWTLYIFIVLILHRVISLIARLLIAMY